MIRLLVLLLALVGWVWAASGVQQPVLPPMLTETSWGPDAYGYIAKDSNEPGGPTYQWIDISTIGTPVAGLGDDNIVGPFDIGFPFRFYWYDVTTFYIGSNGYLRFSGSGQLSHPFTTMPNPLPPNDLVCIYTADYDPSSGGTVYYWTNYTDTLIVSFVNVPAWLPSGSSGSHNFQVVLSMVDTSITFNIGPQSGSFYDQAGQVGIENNAGDIGILCYNSNVVPANYSIKFYYPQTTTYAVHDVSVERVQNDISGGFFLMPGQHLQVNATIKNTGNQDEANFYAIAELRNYPSMTLVASDSVLISSLLAGESAEITFSESWPMNQTGSYVVRVRTTLTGDMVASNNRKDVELHVVDLPGQLLLDDNTFEQTWSWLGGQGGMALRFVPPYYPVKITQISGYLSAGTVPTYLEIYDDDGPDGQPGTVLFSNTVLASTAGWYSLNTAANNIIINDGAFYVAWRMNGDNSSGIQLDTNSVGSRQAWEYTGVWAPFRNAETSDPMLRVTVEPQEQVVFFDDFEGGLSNWTGDWALTTEASHSPSHSFTDSPNSNYPNNSTLIGQMANGVDLSGFLGARLEFYTKYELETGFDYCYLEASTDGGNSWILLRTYNGEGVVTQFTQEVVDLGAFAGQSDVRIRFRLVTDAAYQTDGMYVDDVKIIGELEDTSPPLMVFQPPQHYEGVPDTFWLPVKITDISGISNASLTFWANGSPPTLMSPVSVSNDTFTFFIPPQEHGAKVEFYLRAVDNASQPNMAVSDTFAYISGQHLIFDDGDPEYIVELNPLERIATRFDAPSSSYPRVTTALLRIYTDINHPLDSVTVHVWEDNGGIPGADLIPPFKVFPGATLLNPEDWTIVDLRPYNLVPSGAFWVGYEVPATQSIAHLYDSPAVFNRSMHYSSGSWSAFSGDFHIRCVLGSPPVAIEPELPTTVPEQFVLEQNYPNPFNPITHIRFGLPANSQVTLSVFNVLGQEVLRLVDEPLAAGWHTCTLNGSALASGIYFYRLEARATDGRQRFQQVRKMLLVK